MAGAAATATRLEALGEEKKAEAAPPPPPPSRGPRVTLALFPPQAKWPGCAGDEEEPPWAPGGCAATRRPRPSRPPQEVSQLLSKAVAGPRCASRAPHPTRGPKSPPAPCSRWGFLYTQGKCAEEDGGVTHELLLPTAKESLQCKGLQALQRKTWGTQKQGPRKGPHMSQRTAASLAPPRGGGDDDDD